MRKRKIITKIITKKEKYMTIIKKSNRGFSLTELIIVIAIMAILAAALAPVVVHFIDKARKAVDIETAQTLFEAAELASASHDDDVGDGWTVPIRTKKTADVARTYVNAEGHNCNLDRSVSAGSAGTYEICCIAWCRGVEYQSKNSKKTWENSQFKSTLDNAGNDEADLTRAYTDEFLRNLYHMDGVGKVYGGNGNNSFDGYHKNTMLQFKYLRNAGYGNAECWMVCVRCDNEKPEIWIGDKNLNGRGANQKVRPLYRIYPDPCKEYKK